MCVILDASARDDVFGKTEPSPGEQFFRWLERPSARLVLGGKLTEELAGSNSFARWAETAIADGRGCGPPPPTVPPVARKAMGSKGGGAAPCQAAVFNTASAGLGTLRVPDSSPASAPDGLPDAEISGRRNLHTIHGEARFQAVSTARESGRFPKGSSAVPESDRPPPTPPPSPPDKRQATLRFAGSGGLSTKRAQSAAGASLDARAGSLSEEDSTILRIALLDQADSGLLSFGGLG